TQARLQPARGVARPGGAVHRPECAARVVSAPDHVRPARAGDLGLARHEAVVSGAGTRVGAANRRPARSNVRAHARLRARVVLRLTSTERCRGVRDWRPDAHTVRAVASRPRTPPRVARRPGLAWSR